MRRIDTVLVVLVALFAGISAVALTLWFGARTSVWVTFVSDPPGATLVSTDSRSVLGVAPVTVSYARPVRWQGCASFGGFRARWADGREMAVNRIELCPDGGDDQELRFSAPTLPQQRRRITRSPVAPPAPARNEPSPAPEMLPPAGAPITRTAQTPEVPAPMTTPSTPASSVDTTRASASGPPDRRNANQRRMAVQVVGRESNETAYSYVVPGYVSTQSNGYANCFGTSSGTIDGDLSAYSLGNTTYGSYSGRYRGTTTTNCSGSSSSTTTIRPPSDVSYSVTGATLSLRLPDGRVAVVNCQSKPDWWSLGQVARSCRVPPTERFEAEFNGDNAKLFWRIGLRAEKGQSETYKLIEILEPAAP